eukprot:10779189-Alexandrium_andersonii.AAC.1
MAAEDQVRSHPLTRALLQGETTLRGQLGDFIGGQSLSDLPELDEFQAKLSLIGIAERGAERPHA